MEKISKKLFSDLIDHNFLPKNKSEHFSEKDNSKNEISFVSESLSTNEEKSFISLKEEDRSENLLKDDEKSNLKNEIKTLSNIELNKVK